MKKLVKLVLQATIPVLCGLLVVNWYVTSRNLKLVQKSTEQRLGAAETQADIARIAFDLQQMETSQRGYLLTGDSAYLGPYEEAGGKLQADLNTVKTRLAAKDRPAEAQLESVVQAKVEEMKETIHLRQQGYRHKAFLIVGSNRGKTLMEEARASLDALAASQARDAARSQQELRSGAAASGRQSRSAILAFLAVAIAAFFGFRAYMARLERAHARDEQQLRTANFRLERFASAMFGDLRGSIDETRVHADALLRSYGDYLPRQAHERLEQIQVGARHMISTLEDLSTGPKAGETAVHPEINAVTTLSA